MQAMYKEFYNFSEYPFNITADPEFFFSSAQHHEAFSHLFYGIGQRKGIILITGEVGTGKTTLCRTLVSRLEKNVKTALILNPSFSDVQLLKLIVKDFGLQGTFKNKFDVITAFNDFLLKETSLGNNVVLIVDEAQNLQIKQLEQIRLLSNLETEKEKLLQIILVGQPELYEKLKLPALRQLYQRIAVRHHLLPLTPLELHEYIRFRLKTAQQNTSFERAPQFTNSAIQAIYKHSQGTPRTINILCDRILLAGYVNEMTTIDETIVHKCAEEVF